MFLPLRTDVPLRSTPWMNWFFILANILIFIAQKAYPPLTSFLELNPRSPALYQYFTYAFLHANVLHIASNMLFLYIFGNNVNDRMGHLGYLPFYLAGAAIAGTAHVLVEQAPVIGASGATFAVTGAFLILFPRAHVTVLYFFILIGVAEIASLWFILAYFALNVFNQFSAMLGGASQVAYSAHLGGAIFGAATCTLLLALKLLPRDQFDVISLIDRWNRRRQYRGMVAGGYNPWAFAPAPAGSSEDRGGGGWRGEQKPAVIEPKQEQILTVRAAISEAIAHGDWPAAIKQFMELRAIDPTNVLSRQTQMDVANHLFEQSHHAAAADAYEGYLRIYPKGDQVEHVLLMLGLLYARYLKRDDLAEGYLRRAIERLRNDRDIELAKTELARIAYKST